MVEVYRKWIGRSSVQTHRPADSQHSNPAATVKVVLDDCARVVRDLDLGNELERRVLRAIESAARRELVAPSETDQPIVEEFRRRCSSALGRSGILNGATERVLAAVTEAMAREVTNPPPDQTEDVEQPAAQSPRLSRAIELPQTAPALWKNRNKDDFRNPANFILHHYEPWLGEPLGLTGLTRVDIKKLDPPLYRALHDWLDYKSNEQSDDWAALKDRLPTLSRRNDQVLKAYESRHLGGGEGVPVSDLVRIGWVAHARQKRRRSNEM